MADGGGIAIMKLHSSTEVSQQNGALRGPDRLVKRVGAAARPHPDGRQVRQFLKELRLPLAASEGMLELMQAVELPQTVRMALAAVSNHNEFMQRLIADYVQFGRLEQNAIEVQPGPWTVCDWLENCLAAERTQAAGLGIELVADFQTLLPSCVTFDGNLASSALSSVLHVAMQRALPGRMDVAIRFEDGVESREPARLVFEVATRGGGFSEIEQSYVFAPFQVRDAAARPLLGLSVAQRLTELFGGELCVESPGASICNYRVAVNAAPEPDAEWTDPSNQEMLHGPVRPGRVMFVGRRTDVVDSCRSALEEAGYKVEQAECAERALPQLEGELHTYSSIVMDASCVGDTVGGFLDAVRALGLGAPVIALLDSVDDTCEPVGDGAVGPDRVLLAPSAEQLLLVLRETRSYRDRKNATSAS